MANGPLTLRAQLDAVVSSVPVKPVMSMLAIVVAAASVVVPVGFALKIALFEAMGVQAHAAPPDVFDQFAPVAVVPPAVGVVAQTPPRRTVAHTCFAVPLTSVAVIVWAPPGITP